MILALAGVSTCAVDGTRSRSGTPLAVSAPERRSSASLPATKAGRDVVDTEPASDSSRTVVLVALDGVRWQDVFEGVDGALADRYHVPAEERLDATHLLPNLSRLMTTDGAAVGAPGAGAPMEASGPNFVSLPGYMELLTGRSDSGCTSNDCSRVPFSTVAEDVVRDGLGTAAIITSWEEIDRAAAAYPGHVLATTGRHGGAGRAAFLADPAISHLMDLGARASAEPGHDDFRPDVYTAAIARVFLASAKPAFLFVGLGETDEYGHRDDYRGYLRALREADTEIGYLDETVSWLNATGHPATLFVTTDHGRSNAFTSHGREYPESARVWLVASGAGIEARGRVTSFRRRHLSDVSQTIRSVIGIDPIDSPHAGDVLSELGLGPGPWPPRLASQPLPPRLAARAGPESAGPSQIRNRTVAAR